MNSYIPHTGDLTTRVIGNVSLLYRVRRVETRPTYKLAILSLVGDVLGYQPTAQVYFVGDGNWQWDNGDPAEFTSGAVNELALKATRLDTLHQCLRNKYFYYATMGRPADSMTATTAAMAIRDEYTELLFLVETGLRYDQDVAKYEEFSEALHDEWLASQEG